MKLIPRDNCVGIYQFIKLNIMKKISRLKINSEKLMKNDELLALRGGISWLSCRINDEICWSSEIDSCAYAYEVCSKICGAWTEAICTGS
jgi:hypothetical protein